MHDIAVTPRAAPAYVLTRANRDDTDLRLSPIPKGRTPASPLSLNGQAEALAAFNFDDVRALPRTPAARRDGQRDLSHLRRPGHRIHRPARRRQGLRDGQRAPRSALAAQFPRTAGRGEPELPKPADEHPPMPAPRRDRAGEARRPKPSETTRIARAEGRGVRDPGLQIRLDLQEAGRPAGEPAPGPAKSQRAGAQLRCANGFGDENDARRAPNNAVGNHASTIGLASNTRRRSRAFAARGRT